MVNLEPILKKKLAEELNMSEEDVEKMFEDKTDEEVREFLSLLGTLGETAGTIPENARGYVLQYLMTKFSDPGTSDLQKVIKDIMVFRETLRALSGTDMDAVAQVSRKIDELIEAITESKRQEEVEAVREAVDELKSIVHDVLSKALENKKEKEPEKPKNPADNIRELVQNLKALQEAFSELELVAGRKQEVDPESLAKLLEKYGYRVERPVSYEAIKKQIEEEIKQKHKEIEEKVKQELERKYQMTEKLLGLLGGIVSSVISGLSEGMREKTSSSGALAEFIKRIQGAQEGGGNE